MKKFPNWIVCVVAFWLVCSLHARLSGDGLAEALGFNTLLALLPYLFSKIFLIAKKLWLKIAMFLAWILFLPNTFYMITDLIHVPPKMEWIGDGWELMHTKDVLHWLLLLIIGFGCIMAFVFGLESIYAMVTPFGKKLYAHLGVALTCGLCGFGIFMGRFLRLNSWDVMHPLELIAKIYNGLDMFALIFTAMMGGTILILYYFYVFIAKKKETDW